MKEPPIEDYKLLINTLEHLWVLRKAEEPTEHDGAKRQLLNVICQSHWSSLFCRPIGFHGWGKVWTSFEGSWEQFLTTIMGILSQKARKTIEDNLLEYEEDEI